MADVTGPINTLPGAQRNVPDGQMCDLHPNTLAVCRVQGETDSMGSEMNDMCQVCLDAWRAYRDSAESRTGMCDWCKASATDLADRRDYDEGMSGPIYRVCGACRKRQNEAAAAELADDPMDSIWSDYDDSDNDDTEED